MLTALAALVLSAETLINGCQNALTCCIGYLGMDMPS